MKLKKLLCAVAVMSFAGTAFAASMANYKLMGNPSFIISLATGKTATPNISVAAAPRVDKYDIDFAPLTDLEYLINQTFLNYELLPSFKRVTAEDKPIVLTATALRAGLLNYAKSLDSKKGATGTNAAIDKGFKEIATTLNKIQNSSNEVIDDLWPTFEQLADLIIANQDKMSASVVDPETAIVFLVSFSTVHHR